MVNVGKYTSPMDAMGIFPALVLKSYEFLPKIWKAFPCHFSSLFPRDMFFVETNPAECTQKSHRIHVCYIYLHLADF